MGSAWLFRPHLDLAGASVSGPLRLTGDIMLSKDDGQRPLWSRRVVNKLCWDANTARAFSQCRGDVEEAEDFVYARGRAKSEEQSCGLAGTCDTDKGRAIGKQPRGASTGIFKCRTQFAVPRTPQRVDDGNFTRQPSGGKLGKLVSYGKARCQAGVGVGRWRSR